MTRKQLEQCITFMSAFGMDVPSTEIEERFGVLINEGMSAEAALSSFIEAKGIKLESEIPNE